MKDLNLFEQIKKISRSDKFDLMLFLVTELAQEEELINTENYLDKIRNSNEAAHQLMTLLEQEKEIQNVELSKI
ncbi:MAG TPA: hypothetical protein V6C58_15195 [Allocoleopsis sp.]